MFISFSCYLIRTTLIEYIGSRSLSTYKFPYLKSWRRTWRS
jgi:hypothetical protein